MCSCSVKPFLYQVKVVVRVGGLDVTKETVQKEVAATEAEAVAAMTVAVMTAVVDTTAVEEVDLLVWGKLHSATAPKVPPIHCEI